MNSTRTFPDFTRLMREVHVTSWYTPLKDEGQEDSGKVSWLSLLKRFNKESPGLVTLEVFLSRRYLNVSQHRLDLQVSILNHNFRSLFFSHFFVNVMTFQELQSDDKRCTLFWTIINFRKLVFLLLMINGRFRVSFRTHFSEELRGTLLGPLVPSLTFNFTLSQGTFVLIC